MEQYYFIFDDFSSAELGIKIKKWNKHNLPSLDIEKVHIEGKNGDLLIDKGSYQNKLIEIECIVKENLDETIDRLKAWLSSVKGYKRLIFSDDEEFYYEASFSNSIDFDIITKTLGEFVIIFDCKPFRKSAFDEVITLSEAKTIHNYWCQSEPLIKVVGDGDITVNINNQELILKGVQSEIIIDSELYNAYKLDITNNMVNENNKMYSDFPVLEKGENNISWTGNVTKLEINPRWVVL